MQKYVKIILFVMMLVVLPGPVFAHAPELDLSPEEDAWIHQRGDGVLKLGLDPYSGMDFFMHDGDAKGYVIDLAQLIEDKLGIEVEIVGDKTWGEVYSGLSSGDIDILFGANETPERRTWMAFTKPVHRYPYAAFALKNSGIQTMGDLDGRRLGIIEGDIIESLLPGEYPNVQYDILTFESQIEAIGALLNGEIDGFITSGGGIVYEFLFKFPELAHIATIDSITSDMTLSTRLEDEVLAGILDKIITVYSNTEIADYIAQAQIDYNREILNLSEAELTWLKEDGRAVVGIADDYLPFDYYVDGHYRGITGELLDEISSMIGVDFSVVHGPFSAVYNQALEGQVDVMNIAKTEARTEFFNYPRPFSTERDIIVGKKSSERVQDVYGLNGKRIAVIDGFWHEEFILKNLKDVEIVITKDIKESLKLVRSGEADYLIENPTVIEYYVDGLGYTDIVKKGDTSKDSYLYLGVSKRAPELASIIDKALMLIDYNDVKFRGIDSTPELRNELNGKLTTIVVFLSFVLIIILLALRKVVKDLIAEKASTQLLKEREKLIYTDALTGLSNRLHYNHLEVQFDNMEFPQCIFIADLNNLKKFNDSYGHHLGDVLIQSFAQILKESCSTEYIFRMGGDEFMMIKPGCDADAAKDLIGQIQAMCRETKIPTEQGTTEHPEAAFGYSVRLGNKEALEAVVIKADNQMYRHKAQIKGKMQTI